MLAEMPSRVLDMWQEYFLLEPEGSDVRDVRTAVIAQTVAAGFSGKFFPLQRFIPHYDLADGVRAEAKKKKKDSQDPPLKPGEMSTAEMERSFMMFAALHNAKLELARAKASKAEAPTDGQGSDSQSGGVDIGQDQQVRQGPGESGEAH